MAFAIDRFYSPAPYTIVVPDGRVWGEFGAAIAPDNKLLWDVSIFPPFVPDEHPVFRQTRLTPAVFVDETVALLTFCASGMYYHWMFDVLSRFDLLARSGIAVDRFIVNGVRSAFQLETLAALGIPQDKLIHCHADFHLQAKRLVVPVAAAIEWGPHQWQIRYLREELLTRNGIAPSPGWERIYIGRARASHRRVTNEEQVCDVLRVRGFRCIELEDYTVAQQAAILASARFVVAAHGSGLTNLLFCQPGTKVVELFPSNFPVYVYWLLCNHLDLDYYHLFAEGERAADKLDPKHGYDDMFVNPGKLATVLDRIGSGA
ncbi:MAG: glycosyltransferase family 61 protein [Paenibacillaceae bacterium]|nr:glycosyltransferase family 61 protein [Paenibacillaceae bacterium]